MAITPLSYGGKDLKSASDLTIEDVELPAGNYRVLLVSAHSRGNAGNSEVTTVQIREAGTTNVVVDTSAFVLVQDIDANDIIHVAMWLLFDEDFPAPGTYDVYLDTAGTGAFQVGAYVRPYEGVKQETPTNIYSNTNAGGYSISVSSISVDYDGSFVVDTCSVDSTAAGDAVLTTTGLSRTGDYMNDADLNSGTDPLALSAAGASVGTGDDPISSIGWDTGSDFNNRMALSVIMFEPAGTGGPGSPPFCNVMQWGANQ